MAADWRIGIGYDIHAVVPDRVLMLGGIEVPADFGLSGHTDGDIVLHAVIDAMLGAAGLPDIGEHFPDDDPAHKGRRSSELLEEALREVNDLGWRISNLDLTIRAEKPKLAEYKNRLRQSLAGLLSLDPERIGVKAKTNEGFDAVGEGRAIACEAALILKRGVE